MGSLGVGNFTPSNGGGIDPSFTLNPEGSFHHIPRRIPAGQLQIGVVWKAGGRLQKGLLS